MFQRPSDSCPPTAVVPASPFPCPLPTKSPAYSERKQRNRINLSVLAIPENKFHNDAVPSSRFIPMCLMFRVKRRIDFE